MDACNEEVFSEFEKYAKEKHITFFKISSLNRSGTKQLIDYIADIIRKDREKDEEDKPNIKE